MTIEPPKIKRTNATSSSKEWELLWALFTTQEPLQQELLCSQLLQLSAASINRYLLEYVYLAVTRPSGPLERAITELCGRSFNTAVQVSWLLLALLQDQPGNRHIQQFRNACERAALSGGGPNRPHYLHASQQQQEYQQSTPHSSSPAAGTPVSSCAALASSCANGDISNVSSIPASPFASTAEGGVNSSSSRPSSPCKSPSAVAALAASVGSISGSHRFRDSLDLELMKHASQDLAIAALRMPAVDSTLSEQQSQKEHGTSGSSSPPQQRQQEMQAQGQLAVTGVPNGLASIKTGCSSDTSKKLSNKSSTSRHARAWAVPGSVASAYSSFDDYLAAREAQLDAELGEGQGVTQLMAASHAIAVNNGPQGVGWLVTHEEQLLSTSMLLELPPRSPRHAASRDSYLATLDFVDALCETSGSLTRFPQSERRKVLRRCLGRINQEIMDAAAQGIAVRYPINGCRARVLQLMVNEAVILNSREKVQEDADFVDEVLPDSNMRNSSFSCTAPVAVPSPRPRSASPGAFGAFSFAANNTDDVLSTSPDQQEHPGRPLQPRQQQLLQQLHGHQRQQQQRPRSETAAVLGASPLSRSCSPAPESRLHTQQQQQLGQEVAGISTSPMDATAAQRASCVMQYAAGSSFGVPFGVATDMQQCVSDEVLGAAALSDQQLQQQLQQQLSFSGAWGDSSCLTDSRSHTLQHVPRSSTEAAAAPLRPPSQLELEMQEAAAVLRGDKLIKLHLSISESHINTSSSSQCSSRLHSPIGDAEDLLSGLCVFGELPADKTSEDLGRQTVIAAGFPLRSATGDDDSDVPAGPWVFGELPAAMASAKDISRLAAAGLEGSGTAHDQQQVRVHLEVVGSGPVVPQLSLQHRNRRRMPSVEAIDIIAGKLGKDAIPPPTEIGPPLQLPGELSISSSCNSSVDGDADWLPVAHSPATGHLQTVAEGVPAVAAGGTDVLDDGCGSTNARADSVDAVGSSSQVLSKTEVKLVDAEQTRPAKMLHRKSDQHDGWHHVASPESAAAAAAVLSPQRQSKQQQEQQWQQKQSWWGFLRRRQQQPASPAYSFKSASTEDPEAVIEELSKQADAVYGERWAARTARVRKSSCFGDRPGWGLAGMIVKSGDDCRQELLALQLIREFGDIWAAAGLPVWVLPFEVLVTSADTALIQLIPDSSSIHSIKARSIVAAATATPTGTPNATSTPTASSTAAATAAATPRSVAGKQRVSASGSAKAAVGDVSLSEHFFAKWKRGSPECLAAQRRFVESLAGYCLVTYFLQVKDRHNGNIMMDHMGRVIHIDYGFMLSNAPGGNWVRFESAPMKLTRELLEIMDSNTDGQQSALFDYFKVLCIQGFLAARKERHRITGLVRIMADCTRPGAICPTGLAGTPPTKSSSSSSTTGKGSRNTNAGVQAPSWPCFYAGADKVLAALEGRFVPQLSESACVQHVLLLISDSLDAWSSRQYDYYQRVSNGIL